MLRRNSNGGYRNISTSDRYSAFVGTLLRAPYSTFEYPAAPKARWLCNHAFHKKGLTHIWQSMFIVFAIVVHPLLLYSGFIDIPSAPAEANNNVMTADHCVPA